MSTKTYFQAPNVPPYEDGFYIIIIPGTQIEDIAYYFSLQMQFEPYICDKIFWREIPEGAHQAPTQTE